MTLLLIYILYYIISCYSYSYLHFKHIFCTKIKTETEIKTQNIKIQ